jgi:hypothetical protein
VNGAKDIAGPGADEYLQAAGSADKMVVEIRKPAGEQSGLEWVRFVVGHPHGDSPHRDESIALPDGTEKISRPELFEAQEAAELFMFVLPNRRHPGRASSAAGRGTRWRMSTVTAQRRASR